jgi:hypothetical protein
MKKIIFLVAAMNLALGVAQAQTTAPVEKAPLRWVAGMGLSVGGDNLATASYTNGSSQDIKAGGGVYFTGGVDYRVCPEFSLQGTVNFHVDDTSATNGSIKFQRFPIELLGYYHVNPQWRFGGGVRYTTSPKLSSSGAAAGMNFTFDNAVSAVVEGEYFPSEKVGVKLRYVKEKFEATGYRSTNANHIGISGNLYF